MPLDRAPSADEVETILADVAARRGIDFRDYRRETLERGIFARFLATRASDVAAYRTFLAEDPYEMGRLVEGLVIPVTTFFRDAPVFDAVERRVVPDLIAQLAPDEPLRAWAVGVATGEEAWSLGMVLACACEDRDGRERLRFDLLASDIDARSLGVARRGCYSADAIASVPDAMRDRFLRAEGDELCIDEPLRRSVHFAQHDVMGSKIAPAEAVVASFQLIVFRNVLIYFDRRLQRKALERLVSLLEPGGVLVLGPVETLPPEIATRFAPYPGIDAELRVFRLDGGGAA